MRVISGCARGHKLVSSEGTDTRPTSDRVKESVFNIICPQIPDARVLDLFAGSAALGIEALSRGAQSAVFVEKAPAAIKVIEKNLTDTRLAEKAEIKRCGYEEFLRKTDKIFDIVFVDPPYKSGFYATALSILAERNIIACGGIVVCEHEYDIAVPCVSGYKIYRERKYGRTCITLLIKE